MYDHRLYMPSDLEHKRYLRSIRNDLVTLGMVAHVGYRFRDILDNGLFEVVEILDISIKCLSLDTSYPNGVHPIVIFYPTSTVRSLSTLPFDNTGQLKLF